MARESYYRGTKRRRPKRRFWEARKPSHRRLVYCLPRRRCRGRWLCDFLLVCTGEELRLRGRRAAKVLSLTLLCDLSAPSCCDAPGGDRGAVDAATIPCVIGDFNAVWVFWSFATALLPEASLCNFLCPTIRPFSLIVKFLSCPLVNYLTVVWLVNCLVWTGCVTGFWEIEVGSIPTAPIWAFCSLGDARLLFTLLGSVCLHVG